MANMTFATPNPPDARKQDPFCLRWVRRTDDGATGPARIPIEAPDPVYWTAYDYYMIEREARALRREHLYTMIATHGTRLWLFIANGAPALVKRPGRPAVS